jgi:hypothetical protein
MSYRELAPDEVIVTQAKNSEIQNILSCELEAAEAYREVISTLSPDAQTWKLELLMHDHKNAVSYWKTQVTVIPKHKRQGNTAWSKVINTLLSKTSLERVKFTLERLKEGELSGTKLYQNLLNNSSITAAQKSYIKTILLPAHKSHLKRLERMYSHALELTR